MKVSDNDAARLQPALPKSVHNDEGRDLPRDPLTDAARITAARHASVGRANRVGVAGGWRRGWLLWPLLLLGVHGCTQLSRSTADAVKLSVHGKTSVEPTAAEVAAKPYYQLEVSGPDGTAVLILGNVDGQRQAWYGSHHVVVFTEYGRVVKTSGLSRNLDELQLSGNDPFVQGLQNLATAVTYQRREDWSPGYRYGVPVKATLSPASHTVIDILGTSHRVLQVDEQLEAPAAHYRATNHYWIDPQDGFVWKSEQSIAPGLTLTLVQLRPYRESPETAALTKSGAWWFHGVEKQWHGIPAFAGMTDVGGFVETVTPHPMPNTLHFPSSQRTPGSSAFLASISTPTSQACANLPLPATATCRSAQP